jgi:uncharacterized protein (TIGR03118 family)
MADADTINPPGPESREGTTEDPRSVGGRAFYGAFDIAKLTADQPGLASNFTSVLVNAWGIAPFQGSFWIADGGTGKLAILDGRGVPVTGTVASGAIDLGEGITGIAVTGVAPGDTTRFQIHTASSCGPAQLIVASETGKLFAVNLHLSTTGGVVVVDRSSVGAIYKGVAVIQGRRGPLILVADFHNARIDVFDANFAAVQNISFDLPRRLPPGFAPFNVMSFDDTVYVTYAKQDADREDDVPGRGLGAVAAFEVTGRLLRLAESRLVNAPWGMALAHNAGPFHHVLLVGNFGDGHVTAFDPTTLRVRGQLRDRTGAPIVVPGLWGLAFGAGVSDARPDGLYFAAGPDDEMHGLFGVIAPVH